MYLLTLLTNEEETIGDELQKRSKVWTCFALVTVALFSLGLAVYEVNINPLPAFYLAQLRAWELLIGGILALNVFPLEKPLKK